MAKDKKKKPKPSRDDSSMQVDRKKKKDSMKVDRRRRSKGQRVRQQADRNTIQMGRATETKDWSKPMVPFLNSGLITPPPLFQMPRGYSTMAQAGIPARLQAPPGEAMDVSVGSAPLTMESQFRLAREQMAQQNAAIQRRLDEWMAANNPVRAAEAAQEEAKYDDGKEEAVFAPGAMPVVLPADEVRDVFEDLGRNVAASAASSSSSSQQVPDEYIQRAVNPFVEDMRRGQRPPGDERVGFDIFFPPAAMSIEDRPRLNAPPDHRLRYREQRRREIQAGENDEYVHQESSFGNKF